MNTTTKIEALVLNFSTDINARRPFALPWEADQYALMLKDDFGLGDRVRYLRTEEGKNR